MSHTPGPWVVDKSHLPGYWILRAAAGQGFDGAVASLAVDRDGMVYPRGTSVIVITEDDAALVAAAPDLLAALEFLSDESQYDAIDGPTKEQLSQARAAIAKAEGSAVSVGTPV